MTAKSLQTAIANGSLAFELAKLAANLNLDDLPPEAISKAQLHILDTLGLALASHTQDFAAPSLAGFIAAGSSGNCTIIGTKNRLSARDAALANGLLMHGLDFDDTHLASIIHASVASLPAALALGEHIDASWNDMLCAYILGMETAIRIGASVQGGFHHVGFHATGVVSHFSSAVVAGKLLGLNAEQICAAQGVAASTASGIQVFLEEGAWTKRMHPGWGALSGITAAYMVKSGFVAPSRPYEGRFGLYETHLHETKPLPEEITRNLGKEWRMIETAIKPYPICHFNHGCAEAAIVLHGELKDRINDIKEIVAWLPEPTLHIIAEPADVKQHVTTDYEAKFSAQFDIAMCLLRGRFGLKELTAEAIAQPDVQELTKKVICKADPNSAFPKYFSGGLTITMKDGTTLSKHIPVNKGAGDRTMTAEDIYEKFIATAQLKANTVQAVNMKNAINSAQGSTVRHVMQSFVL